MIAKCLVNGTNTRDFRMHPVAQAKKGRAIVKTIANIQTKDATKVTKKRNANPRNITQKSTT